MIILAGALVINGSSMTSLYAFAHLTSISTLGQTVNVNGASYSVVVIGLCFSHISHVISFERSPINKHKTGNSQLSDLGHLLDVQITSSNATLVSNNGILCFNAAQEWGRRTESYLEFNISQVCLFF